ncbi:surface lipoprotein assembly modifier [Testudinibacter sp. P27/CKL/0425]
MCIQKQFVILLVMPFFINNAYAETDMTEIAPRSAMPSERVQMVQPKLSLTPQALRSHVQKKSISITREELANYPELVIRTLIPALMQNNAEGVAILLPIYEQQENIDIQILTWGKAILASQQQNYSHALTLYRKLFSQNPRLIPLRYQMAKVLYLNNNNEAAKEQFEKLRSEPLPPLVLDTIDLYLKALRKKDEWSFQGSLGYLNDRNVNNAPKTGTEVMNFKASGPESAEGVNYNLSADKKWSLNNGFFSKISLFGYGHYYWDNKKYNELNIRVSAGLGYQTAHIEVSLMPFTERRWFSGGSSNSGSLKRFSQSSGLRIDVNYWLTSRWQISSTLEYGEQRHATRKHLDGNNYLWSNTLLYVPNSNQHWFVSAGYSRNNALSKSDAYDRKNIRVGWGQEWPFGISSQISLNYAKREYNAPGFANIRQKNKEYGGQINLWHRNIHFWGITPRITWSYNKVDSNNAFYSYDKNSVYLEMSKRF